MSDEGNVNYNIQVQLQASDTENNMDGGPANQGAFYYNMEESLAENMYNLSMEAAINDDDVDLNPTPSSRPPPQPFGINQYSEDDPAEMENITTLAGIANMIEKHNTEYPDVSVLMKCIDPGFFKYGTVLDELEKWSRSAQEYVEENECSPMDADSSYSL